MIDLHVHSNYSDGTDTVEELIDIAKERNVSEFSLTDHDTVLGLKPVIKLADKNNINIIPGIEVTSLSGENSIHILGYMIDYENSQLLDFIGLTNAFIKKNSLNFMTRLKKNGLIDYEPSRVEELKGFKDSIYLSDLIKAMIKDGYPMKLSDWPKFYTETFGKLSFEMIGEFPHTSGDAVEIINTAGGISSFAHPAKLGDIDLGEMEKLIPQGLNGVEVYYPYHDIPLVKKYEEFCRKHNLLRTGGTDWHGEFTTWDSVLGQYGIKDSKILFN
jgi:hypothetical protein